MWRILRVCVLAFALGLSAAAAVKAAPTAAEKSAALEKRVEALQHQLDAQTKKAEDLQRQSDIKDLQGVVAKLDQRVSDLHNDVWPWASLWLGLLTVVVGAVGVGSYFNADNKVKDGVRKATDDAKTEAENITAKMKQEFTAAVLKAAHEATAQARIITDEMALLRSQFLAFKTENETEISDATKALKAKVKDIISRADAEVVADAKPLDLSSADQKILEEFDQKLRSKPEKDYSPFEWMARGWAALGREQYEAAIQYFNYAIESKDASEPEKAQALSRKAVAYAKLDRHLEAIAVADDVDRRYNAHAYAKIKEQLAKALVTKGYAFWKLGRSEEAIIVYDEVDSRYASASELSLRESVAKALVNKGAMLGKMGRREEAIKAYDEVDRRYGGAPELSLRELVARALVNKGVTLGALGRSKDEIIVYDEVDRRYGGAPELSLREQVAQALVNKGVTLGQLGRSEEAIAVYDEVDRRYGAAEEDVLKAQVAKAKSLKRRLRRRKPHAP